MKKVNIKARYAKKLVIFGKRVKTLRDEKKMTQEQVAYESGISFTTINKLENGHLNPTVATVFAIAESLKVDVKKLFE